MYHWYALFVYVKKRYQRPTKFMFQTVFYEMDKLSIEWKTSPVESKDFRVGPVSDIYCAELIVCSDKSNIKTKAYVDLTAKYISNSRVKHIRK